MFDSIGDAIVIILADANIDSPTKHNDLIGMVNAVGATFRRVDA